MLRLLVSPKWLPRHAIVIAACTACALLGRWQWFKGFTHAGSLVNIGYGLQWWTFAVIVIYGWVRLLRDDLKRRRALAPGAPAPPTSDAPTGPVLYVPRRAPAPEVDDAADDPELAAYNRYLARLNARARG